MEIIDTIVRNGKSDLLIILFIWLAFLLGCIIAFKISDPELLLLLSIGLVCFGVFLILTVFLPEQTTYKAIVMDYKSVQESGYMIIEHLEDDTYLVEEVKGKK